MCWSGRAIPFHQVTGVLDEAATWQEIEEWLAAARVRAALASSRLGLMGHYYSGMLDIMTDVTLVSIAFGTHVEIVEVDELSALAADVKDEEISERVGEFQSQLRRAARLPGRGTAPRRADFGGSGHICCATRTRRDGLLLQRLGQSRPTKTR